MTTTFGTLDVAVDRDGAARLDVRGVTDAGELRTWCARHADDLRAALISFGHVHVRGLPVRTLADFAACKEALIHAPMVGSREETTARTDLGGGLFSATDLPAPQVIRLHNEDSYSTVAPGVLLFGCLVAAASGGATTVGSTRQVLRTLPDELVERFRRRGWMIRRVFSRQLGLPWQRAFGTDDLDEVRRYCARHQLTVEPLAGGGLRTSGVRAALLRHPVTDEEVWFNHVAVFNEWTLDPEVRELLVGSYGPDGLPQNTFYGDGAAIDQADVAVLNRAYDAATVEIAWQPGDLLLVDNLTCAHGRTAYRGERRVLVAMGEPVEVARCRPASPIGTSGTVGR